MKRIGLITISLFMVVVLSFNLTGLVVQTSSPTSKPVRSIAGSYEEEDMASESEGRGVAEATNTRSIEGNKENPRSAAEEAYDNRAFPNTYIAPAQQQGSYTSFQSIAKLAGGKKTNWQELGPVTPVVDYWATRTLASGMDSGRVTALALSPDCNLNDCKLFVGAAGGGVWEADNALATKPNWHPANNGIPSNAIGSLLFDPTDPVHGTLYVGTGEPNGSGDSEAGVGLYKSTDFGKTYTLVPGSTAVAYGRSIGSIGVDPANPNHIFIGTDVARHGSSSVNGGRFTPPGSPVVGLYESTDGGQSFALAFALPSDTVNPGSPTGGDYFRGGVSNIQFFGSTVYFSVFDYGLYRSKPGGYEQVFASKGQGAVANSLSSRTEFSLAPLPDGSLRIYVGDLGSGPAEFYRVDNANVAASALTDGINNPGWIVLSSPAPGTPGYASYNYCGGQCSYDMPVYSPPGAPDVVYIGGQTQYGELFSTSNGRAVQRSADAGVHFTDMTDDAGIQMAMHPDQHFLISPPGNPDIVISGSDGGVVRTSGHFVDASAQCADWRGQTGANLVDCQSWLSAVPDQIVNMNDGLATLQFQSISVNAQNPRDILGGTQDNGTWSYNSQGNGAWLEVVGGDGGQSGIDVGSPNVRVHTYYGPSPDVNFNTGKPDSWDWIGDPLGTEAASFYVPLINDPKVSGTWFVGQQRVWRTQDNGGPQAFLDQYCNEFFGDYAHRPSPCGDWVPLGKLDLTSTAFGTDKLGSYVVAVARTASDNSTLWTATRRGRLFVSQNANAAANKVKFTRIDTASQPQRFISGIVIDPANANHAWVSFSGYNAYTPATPGHVFEVTFNPASGNAVWNDLSFNIGDQPVTGIQRDNVTGDLFISTDFGVAMLANGASTWTPAAGSLPPVAVYGLTLNSNGRVLYAATHGRGIWALDLSK